jgi:hypothetical protein
MLLLLLLAAWLPGCAHAVYPPQHPRDPVKVYLAHYGWHTGVLLPVADARGRLGTGGRYLEFTYGDFDYMVTNKESILDGVGAMLASPQAGLGRRLITIRDGKPAPEVKMPPKHLESFYAGAARVRRLTEQLEARFKRNAATAVLNPAEDAVYVKDDQRYWLANNCSHTARRWLTALGCDVQGSLVTVGFELAGKPQKLDPPESPPPVLATAEGGAREIHDAHEVDAVQENRNESMVATPSPPSNTR